jgi:hypothetical protein
MRNGYPFGEWPWRPDAVDTSTRVKQGEYAERLAGQSRGASRVDVATLLRRFGVAKPVWPPAAFARKLEAIAHGDADIA